MFVRFEGEGGQHCLPYFIALDHKKRAVVLAIRGTLSLQDTVTGVFLQFRETTADVSCMVHCLYCPVRMQNSQVTSHQPAAFLAGAVYSAK